MPRPPLYRPVHPEAARRTAEAIRAKLLSLINSPRRGNPAEITSSIHAGRVIVGPYVIFYEIQDDIIAILPIAHGARDLDDVLKDEGSPDSDEQD